ncbi:MAG: GNAT family N-acetyltransferase [Cellulosilyticaceae bacterium]
MMKIELKERTIEHVSIYWKRTQDEEIKKALPTKGCSEEQAIEMFRKSCLPNATSYGRVIYVEGRYVGDVWCYGIDEDNGKFAMLSYALFDKDIWGKGIATTAVGMFVDEVFERYKIDKIGAFTYSSNEASIRVLEKQGFHMAEEFEENAIGSKYFEKMK